MVLSRFSGGGSGRSFYTANFVGIDTGILNGEHGSFSGESAWSTIENARSNWTMRAAILSDYVLTLQANTNVSDGADLRMRIGTAVPAYAFGTITVVVDQATGQFRDQVNSDPVVAGGRFNMEYREGSVGGSLNTRGQAVLVEN